MGKKVRTKKALESLEVRVTPVFEANRLALFDSRKKTVINEGGSWSSKTYSIIQLAAMINLGLIVDGDGGIYPPKNISICSHSFPHLRRGAMRDFFNIMRAYNWYNDSNYSKVTHVYEFDRGGRIEFFSVDSESARGPRRDILFGNEANLFDYESYRQLSLRTREKFFMDYNPDADDHWIYDVAKQNGSVIINSCYLDNYENLDKSIINEIEGYRPVYNGAGQLLSGDPFYWDVFGLGRRGKSLSLVYPYWSLVDDVPEMYDQVVAGLDFGWNDETAMVDIYRVGDMVINDERIYESRLTADDLVDKLIDMRYPKDRVIYADNAGASSIEIIRRAGYDIRPCDKTKKVIDQIRFLNRHKRCITRRSLNFIDEIRGYRWELDRNGKKTDNPVDRRNHLMDADRYGQVGGFSVPHYVYSQRMRRIAEASYW